MNTCIFIEKALKMENVDPSIERTNRASPFELPEEDERPGSPIPMYRSTSSMSYESADKPSFEPIFREVDGDLQLNDLGPFTRLYFLV
jgi:hypothetical protein